MDSRLSESLFHDSPNLLVSWSLSTGRADDSVNVPVPGIPATPEHRSDEFDEIDTQILVILSENPRMPYQKLYPRLADEGYEMSAEGVRHRVSDLMEATTPFFLLDPDQISWEIVRISVRATNEPGDKQEAFDHIVVTEQATDLEDYYRKGMGENNSE